MSKVVLRGRWKDEGHITLGEGRAVIKLLEAVAACSRSHRHRIQSLEDNLALAFAFEKGRSPSGALNYILRERCALCAAAELMIGLPWVETDRMPADEASRQR